MPERVDLERARQVAGRLHNLGGKPIPGRPVVRTAAWTIERMAEEIEALRAECIAQAARRRPKEYHPTSFRLFRGEASSSPETSSQ